MNIEAEVISYLASVLLQPVSGDVPHPMPAAFITVEKTGGSRTNKVPSARVAVQSWAMTRAEAAQLNEAVKNHMWNFIALDNISSCELDSDYNFTDEETGRFRYQAVFNIVYTNGGNANA